MKIPGFFEKKPPPLLPSASQRHPLPAHRKLDHKSKDARAGVNRERIEAAPGAPAGKLHSTGWNSFRNCTLPNTPLPLPHSEPGTQCALQYLAAYSRPGSVGPIDFCPRPVVLLFFPFFTFSVARRRWWWWEKKGRRGKFSVYYFFPFFFLFFSVPKNVLHFSVSVCVTAMPVTPPPCSRIPYRSLNDVKSGDLGFQEEFRLQFTPIVVTKMR